MKLAELGLKTKPATKYFDGGYISFQTKDDELFYRVYSLTKTNQALLFEGKIEDKNTFDGLMNIKQVTKLPKELFQ